MRRYLLLLLLPSLTLQSSLALKNLDEPRWKSFRDAEQECAAYFLITDNTLQRYRSNGYPYEPSDRKLLSCIVDNLRAWNDDSQQVKDYVFSQFFIPNTVDCEYKQHTQECLQQRVDTLDPNNRLDRVYWTVQCYLANYAGIKEEVQWVPYQLSEIIQTVEDYFHSTYPHKDILLKYCQGDFASNPDYPNLAYHYFVRTGFYNKTTRFDLHKLYVQVGDDDILDDDTEECIAAVVDQYCKEPGRLVHIVLNCLVQYLPAAVDIALAASNVLGNPPECGIPPSPPPRTQPCYNGPC